LETVMTAPLRIAMLSHMASLTSPTGAERSLALLASGLAERGHLVAVVAPGPWALAPRLTSRGVTVTTIRHRCCWLSSWENDPWPLVAMRWLRCLRPSGAPARITDFLARFGADVVHVNCLPHLAGAEAACRFGRPRVWHLREIVPPGPRRRFLARRLRSFGGPLVAVSNAVASWLADEGLGARTTVVRNGVDATAATLDRFAARQALALPADATVVAYLGQLIPHKGIGTLLDAFASAASRSGDLHLVMAGSAPAHVLANLERRVARHAAHDRIHLLGPQAAPEPLLAACDIAAVPSLSPDPLPRAVLEAMAAGRPVVASATGGIGEMVEQGVTGLMTVPGDTEALADAIVELAGNEALRLRMGTLGQARVREKLTLAAHVEGMEALLKAEIRSGGHSR
jgi:glycosyltransferase involved in cell wall biosynthesis